MFRAEVDKYFNLLLTVMQENSFLANPRKVHNLDECGLQMNKEHEKVIVERKNHVMATTSRKRKKPEFEDGMLPSSHVEMNKTSPYIISDMFMSFLKNHVIPRKEPGKVLPIFDGQASHCSDVVVLDLAAENDVIIFCLPRNITQYLLSLGRSFLKPLKTYWLLFLSSIIYNKPNRKVLRDQVGSLLNAT
ncbi:DDE-1 domain-containing protein [Trichonephila clavata]|uniref:DDE-1 domain-containing protein n=1 Tax=Trichonephila clavata TaxID=2740835 RepID=A0A8X6G1D2_TRICU|nr:DDE-1 domain-containing protein [Trichonephila clavata]